MLNDDSEAIKKTEKSLLTHYDDDELEEGTNEFEDDDEEEYEEEEGDDENLLSFIDSLDNKKRKSDELDSQNPIKKRKEVVTEAYDEFEYNLPPRENDGIL